uniref:PIN domain-containing protein n=1 Tax=Candidatus Methanogaster sp. ANME-2c ERB4 TaxID=2759911 RepID=A0A7G9YMF0_9EURY|nr:hypothetical protein CDCKMDEO_00029 [Methanosarcinales archaeon ANME-2c ERB4]
MLNGACMVRAVSNSGPIIHLSEVNCFDALQIADVVIPSAVYHKVTRYDKPGSKELQNSHIPVIRLNEEEKIFAMRLCSAYEIDAGEAEAIALYLSGKYQLFFTDDSDARDVSELYDIEVHGTAGIVARAHSLGLLGYEETKQVMQDSRTKEVVCT